MKFAIKITAQADNDIRNIYEYIAYELQSPENSSGQLDRIEKCIMSLIIAEGSNKTRKYRLR